MTDPLYVFGENTARRLSWALAGLLTAGVLGLMLWAIVGWRASRMGASLSFMGMVFGGSLVLTLLPWVRRRRLVQADGALLLLMALLLLPLAVLPVQCGGEEFLQRRGWLAVALQTLCALPFGAAGLLGLSLLPPLAEGRAYRFWLLAGVAMGMLVSSGAVWLLRLLPGAFLLNLFAAPLLWPVIPRQGTRSLLARMLLTLMVVLSSAFLLLLPFQR